MKKIQTLAMLFMALSFGACNNSPKVASEEKPGTESKVEVNDSKEQADVDTLKPVDQSATSKPKELSKRERQERDAYRSGLGLGKNYPSTDSKIDYEYIREIRVNAFTLEIGKQIGDPLTKEETELVNILVDKYIAGFKEGLKQKNK